MLRKIGCFIDNSAIDSAWLHADVYGQTAIKQTIDGNRVKWGINLYHSLGIFSRRQIDDIFLIFFQKTGFDISCKLSPKETICMKCHILFSEKNKKNISKCRLLKILPRVLSVKAHILTLVSLFALDMVTFLKQNAEIFDDSTSKCKFSKFKKTCKKLSSLFKISEGYQIAEHVHNIL